MQQLSQQCRDVGAALRKAQGEGAFVSGTHHKGAGEARDVVLHELVLDS